MTKIQKNSSIKLFNLVATITICVLVLVLIKPDRSFATPISESKLVQLANQERKTRGLSELKLDPLLYFAASQKAQDMLNKDYFEHYSPYDGKSPWDFIHKAGYDYQKAGENLAMDFTTSEGIHQAWMASSSHKANILKPDYENIAISITRGDLNTHQTTMVVQMFAKPMPEDKINPQSLIIKIRNYILGFQNLSSSKNN